jgi:hypothetical protein
MSGSSTKELEDRVTSMPRHPVSIGAGFAIAAIWLGTCVLLGFLAWLLVTHVHASSEDVARMGVGYLCLVMMAISIVRTGRA